METFAVYWEPVIKTYGIAERTGLCLVTLDLPFNRISDGGDWLIRFASRFDGSLVLIFSRPASPTGLRLHLLLDRLPEKVELENDEMTMRLRKMPSLLNPWNMNLAAFDGACSGVAG